MRAWDVGTEAGAAARSKGQGSASRKQQWGRWGEAGRGWAPAVRGASRLATAVEEALPGTSLSAVQYSTVRDTTDRVGLALHTRTCTHTAARRRRLPEGDRRN